MQGGREVSDIPEGYRGREQSLLKHQFLRDYLPAWAHKLARGAATRKIWFVDCFSGPDKSTDPGLMDTSIGISLRVLSDVHQETGRSVGAIFIEKHKAKFGTLSRFLDSNHPNVDKYRFNSLFSESVDEVERLIGNDPAFIFVDPFGWVGAEMAHVKRLVNHGNTPRDVLVNVMFDFMNRVKSMPDPVYRRQLGDFFGLESGVEFDTTLDEAGICELYRHQLRKICSREYTADIQIPHPTQDRTWFELVVGGGHPEVLKVFRACERRVAEAAAPVREQAKRDKRAVSKKSRGQPELLLQPVGADQFYNRSDDIRQIPELIRESLMRGAIVWVALWPKILESLHVTYSEASQAAQALARSGSITIEGLGPKERAPKDHSVLKLVTPG